MVETDHSVCKDIWVSSLNLNYWSKWKCLILQFIELDLLGIYNLTMFDIVAMEELEHEFSEMLPFFLNSKTCKELLKALI